MKFVTDYRLEDYILNTKWEELPKDIQERVLCCSIDLIGALILGSQGKQYETGIRSALRIGAVGDIPILSSTNTFNLLGAAIAFSHAANSFDIDDGYNMIKGHPGSSFVGGVLAAALEKNCSYKEFLTTLEVCYETAIRWGLAEQHHYQYLHSSGTYGAFGTAGGIGRLHNLSREKLNNALSIADYHAPLTPVMRAVEYPSMNKDGVPFGTLVGTMAIIETEEGESGKTHLLEMPEYDEYIESLEKRYYIRELYFKPFTCCRWAHQPIAAIQSLKKERDINPEHIEQVVVHTFGAAARLSREIPNNTDEAQYNIAFPVASAIIYGDVGYDQIKDEAVNDPKVRSLMKKLSFVIDKDMESQFPQKRLAWVEIKMDDGHIIKSDIHSAPGEHTDSDLSMNWIVKKFFRVTAPILNKEEQKQIIGLLSQESEIDVLSIIALINKYLA